MSRADVFAGLILGDGGYERGEGILYHSLTEG